MAAISIMAADAGMWSAGRDRTLEGGQRLHLSNFRTRDREPHAAEAQRGSNSCNSTARRLTSTLAPTAAATSGISASVWGRNSCSGGSSSRIVTDSPLMMVKSSAKPARCMGRSLPSVARRPATSSLRIISRTAAIRSASKNMCSVRQSPMP